MRPTVHDIAANAGVGLATVDRVLNNRPGVSEKTRAKVEEAIARIGYVRDVAAANLAKGRLYDFDFLVPDNDNSFMKLLRAAVADAASAFARERVRIRLHEVPAFDAKALIAAMENTAATGSAGVAIVGVDSSDVAAAIDALNGDGVPVVTLVSDVQNAARIQFCGINNFAAGRTAASLLGRFVTPDVGKVGVLMGSMLANDHRRRLDGFRAVIGETFPQIEILPVVEGQDDAEQSEAAVSLLLNAQPGLAGVYSIGGGNRGLVRALEKAGVAGRLPVVAHELTQSTRAALRDGTISAVLHQDPGHEVRSAIRVLKAHVDGTETVEGQDRIRIEIYLKDNLPEDA
ncbi:LacI family DNA-binding transcriptional regulator [Rhizobium sp. L1K21]|uniref:LacI family DNA-binding transcriptional regulator n=1 Tax=Rhizobium sp. L1K21 TaxID=2954933 RepID=UPI002093EC29|nr:LacI family DNA-binding transcriptional regulator [Rhizobium sp. L1K21]MCO6184938.1 LacI family DNA-binding transcriptional regulator [Rhizobium sp. L1K21]